MSDTKTGTDKETADPRLTELVNRWASGDLSIEPELWAQLEGELKVIARSLLRLVRENHTLTAPELVSVLYIKLKGRPGLSFVSRGHFFKLAKEALRLYLKDYEKARRRRPQGAVRVPVESTILMGSGGGKIDLLVLLDLLDRLRKIKEDAAVAIELHSFFGCTHAEIADELGLSTKTVQRRLAFARAWISSQVAQESSG